MGSWQWLARQDISNSSAQSHTLQLIIRARRLMQADRAELSVTATLREVGGVRLKPTCEQFSAKARARAHIHTHTHARTQSSLKAAPHGPRASHAPARLTRPLPLRAERVRGPSVSAAHRQVCRTADARRAVVQRQCSSRQGASVAQSHAPRWAGASAAACGRRTQSSNVRVRRCRRNVCERLAVRDVPEAYVGGTARCKHAARSL